MIDKILEFSLRQRTFVVLGALALLGTGIWAALRLPIDATPDITNVQVQVNTEVNGLAPEEIEKLVTFPIEMEMSGVPGMTELRSLSKTGLSQITLVFGEETDIYRARQLVSERMQNVAEELPPGITPKLAPITTGLGEIFYYVIDYQDDAPAKPETRTAQLMELKLIHDFVVKPALRTVPGIAEVNASGGYEKQIVVQPRPDALLATGITFSDLADVVGENVENAGGGAVQIGGEQITIRADSRVQSAAEISQLPIKFRGAAAKPLLVRDVADVGIGSSLRTGSATYNGKEAVLGAALMLAGENSRIIAKRVAEKLEEIKPKLPAGVTITTVYDRTDLVDRTIATVEKNLFEGAILVVVVLLGLLGNWRAALIVALAIPLSFLFAITGMVRFGVSGNLMSLGAVDFGLIIDGAVVMVENIVRRLGVRQHELHRTLTLEERLHTVLSAAKEVGRPTFFGVFIITIVYVPILSLTGIEGKMFKPMALTVIFALIGALILALTLMPVLCSYFLRGISEEDNFLVRAAKAVYRPALDVALRLRWLFVGAAIALFVGAVGLFTRLGAEFVPQLDEGSYAAHMIRTTSIGLDAAIAMQERSEKILKERFPEVTYTFSRIGTSEVATDPMGVNVADTYIFYKPFDQWPKDEHGHTPTKDEVATRMAAELAAQLPAESHLFSQPIEMRFNEILEGTRADIAVKVFGDDYAEIERIASEAREILEQVPGAADVEFDALGKAPMLEIKLKRDAMTRYNVHASEVNATVATALAGTETGVIVDGNRRYPIVVRLPENLRAAFDELKHLPLRSSHEEGVITLGQVADFVITEKVNTIAREFGQRRAAIMVNLRGRDVESFVLEARAKVNESIKLPPGYSIEFGGQFKNLQEARARLAVIVPVALAVIFLLIFLAFGSLRQALLVFSGIPLAVTGGVFALWLRDLPFSISAGIGFIALSGVAVLNGLMLVSYFNQLREEGKSVREATIEGSLIRLRPVLMTALVASLGFLPMALAQGAGAEVQRPLATVVIGGIVSATFLTLLLLPALYDRFERDTNIGSTEPASTPTEGNI